MISHKPATKKERFDTLEKRLKPGAKHSVFNWGLCSMVRLGDKDT